MDKQITAQSGTSEIAKHIDPKKDLTSIQILGKDGRVQIFIQIIGNRVEYLVWSK